MSAIQLHKVKSGAIQAIGYDEPTQTLAVEFPGGRVYYYTGVSPTEKDALLGAESIGKHFMAQIKPHKTAHREHPHP